MIPAPFEYRKADSVEDATALIAEHGEDAKLLAGGHSLIPLMKLRLAQPALLVDVGRLRDLSYIDDRGDHIAIGALTRHMDIERSPVIAQHLPLLQRAAALVGDRQVRHRGTIGGSIAHADPASDLPAAAVALGAMFVAQGPRGRREITAGSFFDGFLENTLDPDEMLVEIRAPKIGEAGWSYQKFTRRAQDWAIVGVAAWRRSDACGIALVNMGPTPILASGAMRLVTEGASDEEAAQRAADEAAPPSDLNASAEYRRRLATVLVRRALESARPTPVGC